MIHHRLAVSDDWMLGEFEFVRPGLQIVSFPCAFHSLISLNFWAVGISVSDSRGKEKNVSFLRFFFFPL